jgi:hypothetical protein
MTRWLRKLGDFTLNIFIAIWVIMFGAACGLPLLQIVHAMIRSRFGFSDWLLALIIVPILTIMALTSAMIAFLSIREAFRSIKETKPVSNATPD